MLARLLLIQCSFLSWLRNLFPPSFTPRPYKVTPMFSHSHQRVNLHLPPLRLATQPTTSTPHPNRLQLRTHLVRCLILRLSHSNSRHRLSRTPSCIILAFDRIRWRLISNSKVNNNSLSSSPLSVNIPALQLQQVNRLLTAPLTT